VIFAVMVPSLAEPPPFTDTRMVMVCGVDGVVQRTHASWLSPSGYSYMLIRSKPVLLVRVDRHMAPMKAVAFFWQIEAI
jgi:hypothetical protein